MKKVWTVFLVCALVLLPCVVIAEAVPAPQPSDLTDLSWLMTYIEGVIVGICLVVGVLLKYCTNLNNKYIPMIVTMLGLLLAIWMYWGEGITPVTILRGLISGAASTGLHQIVKQLFPSVTTE